MVKLDPENALWTWLVEYAGWLVNRAEVGHDGRTPYERLKGKKARLPRMEFGEAVMWKRRPQGGPLGKLSCLWSDGIYLGVKGSTGEYIVGDGAGVWKTRTVRRKIEQERWNKDTIKLVGGVPWNPNVDGEWMKLDVTVMDQQHRDQLRGQREDLEKVPRNFYLKERDFESHGYTEGCPGCISLLKRGTRLSHSKGCRVRMEEVIRATSVLREPIRGPMSTLPSWSRRTWRRRRPRRKRSSTRTWRWTQAWVRGMGHRFQQRWLQALAPSGTSTQMMIDVETSSKKMRVNNVVEVVPVKAVVNEMDEESMDDAWGYGLEADEWEVQDWEKGEKELAEARDEEVKYMVEKKLNMFEFYSEDEMKAITSEAPTSTKWVDVRKMNDDGEEFMRSRLVARDFRPRCGPDKPDLLAPMPPLEAKKMLFIMTVAGGAFEQRGSKDEQKLMFIDVRKAHLNGVVDDKEWVFVELPPEFHVYGRSARINNPATKVRLVVLMIKTRGSLSCQAAEMHLIRVAEHLGASSRRPRHPALDVQVDGVRKRPVKTGEKTSSPPPPP